MLRVTLPSLALLLALPFAAQAASLKDHQLNQTLEKVAKESSVGTPRAINEDILDEGYTVQDNVLIDHLSVLPSHAEQMRGNPDAVRNQLGASVCHNSGYRQLMAQGAVMRYQFSEYQTKKPVVIQNYVAADCAAK